MLFFVRSALESLGYLAQIYTTMIAAFFRASPVRMLRRKEWVTFSDVTHFFCAFCAIATHAMIDGRPAAPASTTRSGRSAVPATRCPPRRAATDRARRDVAWAGVRGQRAARRNLPSDAGLSDRRAGRLRDPRLLLEYSQWQAQGCRLDGRRLSGLAAVARTALRRRVPAFGSQL